FQGCQGLVGRGNRDSAEPANGFHLNSGAPVTEAVMLQTKIELHFISIEMVVEKPIFQLYKSSSHCRSSFLFIVGLQSSLSKSPGAPGLRCFAALQNALHTYC